MTFDAEWFNPVENVVEYLFILCTHFLSSAYNFSNTRSKVHFVINDNSSFIATNS